MRPASTAALLALPVAAVLLLAGCGEPRTVGEIQVQGSVSSYNFYAEYREVRPSGKDKVYLLTDPKTVEAFAAGARELPLSKTMIGAGPNKETLVIEQVKDEQVNAVETKRVLAIFMAKTPVKAPAAAAAPAAK